MRKFFPLSLRRPRSRRPAKRARAFWWWRITALVLVLIALDTIYLAVRLPHWTEYANGPIKKSSFMERYEDDRNDNPGWPALRWAPVALATIPSHMIRAAVIAEDSRFFVHDGFDSEALQDAMEHNLAMGRFIYGGSTISQQTVKNLFFTPSRNPLRKWHEIVFTYSMEGHLKKNRIIELYLNITEFGRGLYGVEAATQYYFGKSVSDISVDEAIELAATLPGPVKNNPASRTRFFQHHKLTIERHFTEYHRRSGVYTQSR